MIFEDRVEAGRQLVLAVPVAPASAWQWLRAVVDEIVCLELPQPFAAVGQFYRDFAQIGGAEVVRLLQQADATQRNGRSRPWGSANGRVCFQLCYFAA